MSAQIFRIGRARTGLGIFAAKPIKRGAYIATYRGPRITNEEADRREARGARYLFTLNKRWTIDGSPRWNKARYFNHSCKPNARPVGRNGGIVVVADRAIEAGEEDYLLLRRRVSPVLHREWRLSVHRVHPQAQASPPPRRAEGRRHPPQARETTRS